MCTFAHLYAYTCENIHMKILAVSMKRGKRVGRGLNKDFSKYHQEYLRRLWNFNKNIKLLVTHREAEDETLKICQKKC